MTTSNVVSTVIVAARAAEGPNTRTPAASTSSRRIARRYQLLKPLCDEFRTDVDIDLAQPARARVDELVRCPGGRDQHVAGLGHDLLVAERERRLALVHDEDLFVGMAVKARTLAGIRVDDDHADAGPDVGADVLARSAHSAAGALMIAIGEPDWIGSPSLTESVSITPALWAVISFSIFIASMMQMSWPSSTVWPCSTRTFHMLPCSGESSSSAPPPPLFLRSPRLGATRPAATGAAPLTPPLPPADGGPITLTSNRRPDTSTVYACSTVGSSSSFGFGGASNASVLSQLLSSSRSRHVSPLAHCSVCSSATWNGIRVLSPSISNSLSAR